MDEWEKILDKMIQAFELDSQDTGPTTKQDEKLFQEGFDLFYKLSESMGLKIPNKDEFSNPCVH